MATSESDDFESADEELRHDVPARRNIQMRQWSSPTAIDSESDDDTEFVPRTPCMNLRYVEKLDRFSSARADVKPGERTPAKETTIPEDDKDVDDACTKEQKPETPVNKSGKTDPCVKGGNEIPSLQEADTSQMESGTTCLKLKREQNEEGRTPNVDKTKSLSEKGADTEAGVTQSKAEPRDRGQPRNPRRSDGPRQLGVKKLGTRIVKNSDLKSDTNNTISNTIEKESIPSEARKPASDIVCSNEKSIDAESRLLETFEDSNKSDISAGDEFTESNMPEEMKSNKKFKEIFKPDGWEGLGDDIELPEELTEEKLQPVLERLSLAGEEPENSLGSWGGWSGWGVSSLITTATAGVSTLTSHVSHGLTLLEESIGVPDPSELAKTQQEEEASSNDEKPQVLLEGQSHSGFGFGNIISGVSSITKLVETTGSKVMTGGLDTLEAIGKKTMEVLQEGDPGLKKKRAFFLNEGDRPILSQILREAKDKAETDEKTLEEKQRARKVHFETLFDDYQGLVHLEALEMLSKQSNIKIQQHLINLDGDELTSIQETLEEVKELCDLGDEDEEETCDPQHERKRLKEACDDLGVNISYGEKLYDIWEESQSYLAPPIKHSDQEIFEYAVSTLAQFTAFSVERFHKTAELLLIKERRSTVKEADALVALTHILSKRIGILASSFCDSLNQLSKTADEPDSVNANITTIFMEASNASSYIQDAFRLLIPIMQVGAI